MSSVFLLLNEQLWQNYVFEHQVRCFEQELWILLWVPRLQSWLLPAMYSTFGISVRNLVLPDPL